MAVDTENYEATFCDLVEPGYYAIEKDDKEYIKIARLEVVHTVLCCDFEILESSFSKEEIEELVYSVLLRRFCDDYYVGKAKFVKFHNNETGEEWSNIYLG